MKNAKHIVCCNVDVAVIGGGPAGVCAALAVAQNGCKVVLVTDRPVWEETPAAKFVFGPEALWAVVT